MPRVVPDQRSKFENEEFFRKLSRECEIRYTGFRDRPHEERQARFQSACRDGRSEIAFVATGTNLSLQFFPTTLQGEQRQLPTRDYSSPSWSHCNVTGLYPSLLAEKNNTFLYIN
uniref:Core-binding factor subunit beta n=1 Tax=Scleropages formosus TaxID=113540 RepID=A0A8C9T872_SCLFO